jgi:hypothetical protein
MHLNDDLQDEVKSELIFVFLKSAKYMVTFIKYIHGLQIVDCAKYI